MGRYISINKKPEAERQQRLTLIINSVCSVVGVTGIQLHNGTRKQPVPYARKLLCWLLHKEEFWQWEIADIFGWKERSTVSVFIQQINGAIQADDYTVKKDIEKINELLLLSAADTKHPN